MHELSLATEIYACCRKSVEAREPGSLATVRVAIGELAGVEPDLLRFAWEAVVSGTADEGAALEIDWRRARQTCTACKAEVPRSDGDWALSCPSCGGPLAIEGGGELDLVELSYTPGRTPRETPT